MNIHAFFLRFTEQALLKNWGSDLFTDFDRLSSTVWVSILIVHWFSLLIQSGSSVPVLKRHQTLPTS